MKLIRNKWFQWFFVLAVSFNLPTDNDFGPLVGLLMVWAILYPSFAFSSVMWKMLRFNYFPTPLQLMKGFARLWPAVKKGPVVKRVGRPPSPPTP